MTSILNLVWFLLAGIWLCLGYVMLGLTFCLTVVGIPLGLMSVKIGLQMLMPFGKSVVVKRRATGLLRLLLALLWVLLGFGPGLCLLHGLTGLLLCLTVIGIPLGLQNLKFMQVALLPLHFELR